MKEVVLGKYSDDEEEETSDDDSFFAFRYADALEAEDLDQLKKGESIMLKGTSKAQRELIFFKADTMIRDHLVAGRFDPRNKRFLECYRCFLVMMIAEHTSPEEVEAAAAVPRGRLFFDLTNQMKEAYDDSEEDPFSPENQQAAEKMLRKAKKKANMKEAYDDSEEDPFSPENQQAAKKMLQKAKKKARKNKARKKKKKAY